MKRLLSIEIQKIWKNKASRVLTLTYFILICFVALFAAIKFNIGLFKFHLAEMGIFNFPYIWHFNTYMAAWGKLFLAIIIVSMMANEYSYGTLKQNLIDGMSKKEFVASKVITVIVFALVSTIFIFILSLVLGLIFSSYTELDIIFTQLDFLLAFFIKLVGFFTFCLFLGIWVKRSAFALGFLILWYIFEKIVFIAIGVMNHGDFTISEQVLAFFPLESMSDLITEPFSRLSVVKNIGQQMGVDKFGSFHPPLLNYFVVVAYTVIFVLSSYKLLKKRDL